MRLLAPGDEGALERFLRAHADTTMFLRASLAASGLGAADGEAGVSWAAAFGDGAIRGVACHGRPYDNVLVEAPERLAETVRAAVGASRRPIAGIVGVRAQAVAARRALGLDAAETTMDSTEDLFALDLHRLRVPEGLAAGAVRYRAPREPELPELVRWRVRYRTETLREHPGPELERKSAAEIDLYQREGRHGVLETGGRVVAYSAFNARLPDCVQVGGVWTPPAWRGRGFARAVVAGSLLEARAVGARRSILFTETDNQPAQAAYRALGYERVGDYGLVLFAEPRVVEDARDPEDG